MRFSSSALATVLVSALSIANAWVVDPVPSSASTAAASRTSALSVSATTPSVESASSSSTSSSTTSLYRQFENHETIDPSQIWGKKVTHGHCRDPSDRDLLARAADGQMTERTPVWLMRQAGRYQASFREYSDRIAFRERSETPAYACELSLQCHRAYGMDGIIMFSDILTPLPALDIDFDVVKGTGPVITTKIRTEQDVENLQRYSFDEKTPFIGEILQQLSKEAVEANTGLIGFVGAPFTLAAYTIEGKSSKHCMTTKQMMLDDMDGSNKAMSMFLDRLSELIGDYACYQIEHGAQVVQIFESWAHQLSPANFERYAKPAALKVVDTIRRRHPDTPIIYFANGGSSYLELQRDMGVMIGLDWSVDMGHAREVLGPNVPVSGNVDPAILYGGTKQQIERAVRECIDKAGGPGNAHILNLGHGVMQGTPEVNVKYLVDEAKRYTRQVYEQEQAKQQQQQQQQQPK